MANNNRELPSTRIPVNDEGYNGAGSRIINMIIMSNKTGNKYNTEINEKDVPLKTYVTQERAVRR